MENTLSRLTKAFKENKIQPLFELQGGMMNKSYVIEFEGKKYVYYQPTVQANEMVDRILERDNHLKVYSLGITSKNLAFFDTGVKINEYIEGQSLNYLDSYDIKKVAKILKKLHESHLSSGKDYLPFKQIEKYENQIKELKIATSNDYKTLLDLVKSEQSFLESQRKVLCHNDFQKSNIIKSNSDEYRHRGGFPCDDAGHFSRTGLADLHSRDLSPDIFEYVGVFRLCAGYSASCREQNDR